MRSCNKPVIVEMPRVVIDHIDAAGNRVYATVDGRTVPCIRRIDHAGFCSSDKP